MSQAQLLIHQADKILTSHGFDWNGQPKNKSRERLAQSAFERRLVKSPCGGQKRK